ncbi:aldo/keto reductase [Rubellimicrobium sp. CFH 75288]|uniref:aldo/keto reductase n=1 Tax=Rubellimicrobium sp. CFH 75288 TaxID=2697034 RepID=UPI001412E868|nr:aldo/keto reductase [Rubellimicrobium sp. CFH 75288]NAZ37033.1 aldo/keto reductase [Rubellimicrobium sp. CFH 75288]
MMQRRFGRTGWTVGGIGFGAWAIGGSWGEVSEADARAALHAALDEGADFIDTADVYGDGRSERLIRRVLAERGVLDAEPGEGRPVVATKLGRRLDPHRAEGYTAEAMASFVDRSRANLGMDRLDLVQLHCPPTAVYYMPEVFEALESMAERGVIRHYGVSVEKVEEGLKAIEFPSVASVQIIWNMFRQRPADLFLPRAREKGVAMIARVPLASGLLAGRITAQTRFADDDHRRFNRHGEAFDVGETFAGVPFEVALAAVEEVRSVLPADWPMAQVALRWCLMNDAVTVVIPGARNADQARANTRAGALPPLSPETMSAVAEIYRRRIAPHVHQRW